MTQPPQRPTPQKLKVKEYAEQERVSIQTVRRWIEKGAIKAVQPGGARTSVRIIVE